MKNLKLVETASEAVKNDYITVYYALDEDTVIVKQAKTTPVSFIFYRSFDGNSIHYKETIENLQLMFPDSYAGPSVVSEEYDEVRNVWKIGFDKLITHLISDNTYTPPTCTSLFVTYENLGIDIGNKTREIIIPYGVTTIGYGAFFNNKMTSIDMPNSVTSIGDYAFQECGSLTSVTIPNSVTSIGTSAFDDCTSLTSVTIPNSVTSIGIWAFNSCRSLTSITIPNSVTSISGRAFNDCKSLTSIDIPNSVTSIGESAFDGCSRLTSVNYTGTKAQWIAISKGSDWNYNVPSTCIVHCTDGDMNI